MVLRSTNCSNLVHFIKKVSITAFFSLGMLYYAGSQELSGQKDIEYPPILTENLDSDESKTNRSAQRAQAAAETSAERHRQEITEETSAQLFNMSIWDKDVSLFLSGYWKGSLAFNWGLANSPLGTTPDTKDSPLLFTQEADLTLSLWIWQKWFLEVSFIDDYDLNTYRAGYQGFPGETVQYVGIGNTGLDFPIFPYLDLGGDSSSSFGAYGRFGSGGLAFHTLVRYDAAAREEMTFVGNRERNFSTMIPNKPLRGRSFVLPDENINTTPVVYLEDKNGPFSGGNRRWRLANPSEYAVSAAYGTVELVREHPGMVAVSYGNGTYSSLGSYNSSVIPPFIPGTGFLGNIQDHFGTDIDLKAYPQPGGSPNTPAIIAIGGTSALIIHEPGTFSPFERQSRYMAPSNTTEDAALIHLSSGERARGFEVLPANTLSMDISMYLLTGDDASRNIYEIIYQNGGRDRRSPYSCWPLADDYPELYLPGSTAFTDDLRLRFTNYGAAGAYIIGTDVIPGSIQVYRGGILDSQVSYDPGSGTVTLASPVGFNEVIRITYLKRSEERRLGSLAAGVGLVYSPEDSPFSAEAALGMRWNISQESYTENGAASPGTVGFGAKTSWNYDNLKASLSLGLGFEQPDTTGLYRIAGMEGNSEIVLGMSSTAGFVSGTPAQFDLIFPPSPALNPPPPGFFPGPIILSASGRAPLVYRNYLQSNILGSSELKTIEWSAPIINSLAGPYPARETNFDVYVAEFDLNGSGSWTGFQAPLGNDGSLLEQAREIVIPLRFYDFSTNSPEILVVAQFGSLPEENSGIIENPNLVVSAPIFYRNSAAPPLPYGLVGQPNPQYGHTIAIRLNDEMRRKLQNANHMRILIINTGTSNFSGRVLVAKPYIKGASWRAITLDSFNSPIKTASNNAGKSVSVVEEIDNTLWDNKLNRLHTIGVNHVLHVEWENMDYAAGTDGRTPPVPLADYRTLSFYLKKPPDNTVFHFLVSQGPNDYPGKSALELTVNCNDLPLPGPAPWYNVEINYREKKLYVNGVYVPQAIISYDPGILRQNQGNDDFIGDGQSAYIAAFVTGLPFPDGSFSIDEICLEDPVPSYRINGGATLEWRHSDALVSIGDKTVVSGVVLATALESAAVGNPFESGGEIFTGAQSRSNGEITVLDTHLSGNLNFMVSNDSNYWSAGHGIGRSFGPLSISETYNTAPPPNNATMNHSFLLGLNTFVYGNISSYINYQNRQLSRIWNGSTGIQPRQNIYPGFSLDGTLNYLEKTEKVLDWMPNYAETWAQSWPVMIPDDGSGSANSAIQNRTMQGRAGFNLDWLPVGTELSFEGNSNVSLPLWLTNNSSSARIEAPFNFGKVQGRLRSQRDISRSLFHAGENIGDDLYQYGQSLSDTSPLWREIPIYALFNSKLDSSMDKAISNYSKESENTRFYEVLALNLLFPERYDALSLVIPVSHFTQFDRTMDQRMDTRLDVLTVSSGFGFSSINLFGAMGAYPVFNFYRNDELRHSITGIISFPRYEKSLWRIQAEQNIRVFGFNEAELAIQNTYTITGGSTTGWIESFSLLWTVPREKTLLSSLYNAAISKMSNNNYFPILAEMAESEYERFFRESLELVLDKSGEYGIYSLLIGHESVVRILGKITLTGFAKLGFQRDVRADELSLLISFGTTLTVSF